MTQPNKAMLCLICLMFTLSTALWGSRLTTDIVQIIHLVDGTSDTENGMAVLNNALSAVDMTNALSLINVSRDS
jgi:hypothetical protein